MSELQTERTAQPERFKDSDQFDPQPLFTQGPYRTIYQIPVPSVAYPTANGSVVYREVSKAEYEAYIAAQRVVTT